MCAAGVITIVVRRQDFRPIKSIGSLRVPTILYCLYSMVIQGGDSTVKILSGTRSGMLYPKPIRAVQRKCLLYCQNSLRLQYP